MDGVNRFRNSDLLVATCHDYEKGGGGGEAGALWQTQGHL